MTPEEWLTGTDPRPMLRYLEAGWAGFDDRKRRLFAAACCRRRWDELDDDRSRRAVEVAERYADGSATRAELAAAYADALAAWWDGHAPLRVAARCSAAEVVPVSDLVGASACEPAACCDLLRDLLGDPFRPVAIWQDLPCPACRGTGREDPFSAEPCPRCEGGRRAWVAPAWYQWNGGAVPRIAAAIYAGRRFGDMPVLADALEEAGCDNRAVLAHCRTPAGHVRGCWLLDLLLRKEENVAGARVGR
jgi:hypothetical protein